MFRITTLLLLTCLFLTGCGSSPVEPSPFQGHWRKYDDEKKTMVEFTENQITMGDKDSTRTGTFRYEEVNSEEPLYQVTATFPAETIEFKLYYESDTISLFSEDANIEGLYEIIIELAPIEP